jgi:hypothetical protein
MQETCVSTFVLTEMKMCLRMAQSARLLLRLFQGVSMVRIGPRCKTYAEYIRLDPWAWSMMEDVEIVWLIPAASGRAVAASCGVVCCSRVLGICGGELSASPVLCVSTWPRPDS